jgi:hypothetical protein
VIHGGRQHEVNYRTIKYLEQLCGFGPIRKTLDKMVYMHITPLTIYDSRRTQLVSFQHKHYRVFLKTSKITNNYMSDIRIWQRIRQFHFKSGFGDNIATGLRVKKNELASLVQANFRPPANPNKYIYTKFLYFFLFYHNIVLTSKIDN